MITTAISISAYILLHCWAKKLNVLDYLSKEKYSYIILFVGLTLLDLFGTAAIKATLVAVAVPFLASYSLPSLMVKAKEIWTRLMNWVTSTAAPEPDEE